jgi:tol-pal system protein YbgF
LRIRWILFFGAAMLAGALGGTLFGPAPAGAVAREIIELQTGVTQLIQGQQNMQMEITQNAAVQRTLIEQSIDTVNKLNTSMSAVQKTTQDFSAASGARLDTMGTQVQGLSDNVADLQARMGKLDQKLTDIQNTLQNVDSKLASPAPGLAPPAAMTSPGGNTPTIPPGGPAPSASGPPASADVLYSNALRDINGKHYDLATQEFQDYMKYYGDTDLASNAQFYLGEVAFMQNQYQVALDAYNRVIENYPKSFKTASARMRKGLCLAELGQKASAVRELRAVVRLYPGTDEAKRAAAKLKEMGATVG